MKASTTAGQVAKVAKSVAAQVDADMQDLIARLAKANIALNMVDVSPEAKKRAASDKEKIQDALRKAAESHMLLMRMHTQAAALPDLALVELTGPEVALFSFAGPKDQQ